MIDLTRYDDDVVLATSEVVAWLGVSSKSILRTAGLRPVPLRAREYHYLAGDVKAAVRGKRLAKIVPMRRMA